ncbi:3'(2'),5'-bisphosphate nucleotidase [Gregarina niphandrodes]|uniref:3'(2'),5'-bisphosphate nucleotidase 1 n=1 Tax=Gregarina niphandrodes TaxID=110365 RepID=A0A023B395_GRENI|nr:3'(2'),5'-bisphosphate nucleotidase [Gregarina niphandrodes]EZG55376.1 3'(2'),5'-bisphosphate nucleotidase [Gregarina niphandrodes]|eukprot:XP_011131600.1 3'(2'),5'-bisphosphate nucleotidase [Gregarina niphandrodes]
MTLTTPAPVCLSFVQNDASYYRLIAIAHQASQAILAIYDCGDYGVQLKDDASPLTDADKAAHELIVAGLQKNWPSIPIVSEEDQDRTAYESLKREECHWLVDPLDGTKEFIQKNGQFTVNIGLCQNGQPIAGVVIVPVTGHCYFGGTVYGAYRLNLNEAMKRNAVINMEATSAKLATEHIEVEHIVANFAERVHVASAKWSDRGLTVMASRSHGSVLTNAILATFHEPNLVKSGSSLKILQVAAGQVHVYPRLVPCCEWDTCAAHAVLLAAGGHMYQLNSNQKMLRKELEYGKPDLLNPFFICMGEISDIPEHLLENH